MVNGAKFLFEAILFMKCKCKSMHSRAGHINKQVGFKQLVQLDLEPGGTRDSEIFNNLMSNRRQQQPDLVVGLIDKVIKMSTNPNFPLIRRGG